VPASIDREVNPNTPSTTPPLTSTTPSSTHMSPLQPPTLKHTSQLPYSIYAPTDKRGAQISHTRGPHLNKFKIVKNKKNEFENKLTTFMTMLIA
jgi:hypothetical protein